MLASTHNICRAIQKSRAAGRLPRKYSVTLCITRPGFVGVLWALRALPPPLGEIESLIPKFGCHRSVQLRKFASFIKWCEVRIHSNTRFFSEASFHRRELYCRVEQNSNSWTVSPMAGRRIWNNYQNRDGGGPDRSNKGENTNLDGPVGLTSSEGFPENIPRF